MTFPTKLKKGILVKDILFVGEQAYHLTHDRFVIVAPDPTLTHTYNYESQMTFPPGKTSICLS